MKNIRKKINTCNTEKFLQNDNKMTANSIKIEIDMIKEFKE